MMVIIVIIITKVIPLTAHQLHLMTMKNIILKNRIQVPGGELIGKTFIDGMIMTEIEAGIMMTGKTTEGAKDQMYETAGIDLNVIKSCAKKPLFLERLFYFPHFVIIRINNSNAHAN